MQQHILSHCLRTAAARRALLGAAVISAIAAAPASAGGGAPGSPAAPHNTGFHHTQTGGSLRRAGGQ